MRLDTYIETLTALDLHLEVEFDNGETPGRLMSWRGRYQELTLDTDETPSCPMTVGVLLRDAMQANGGTFQGYKGGDYTMSLRTPVWADPWGECRSMAIGGIEVRDGKVVIRRIDIGDYV